MPAGHGPFYHSATHTHTHRVVCVLYAFMPKAHGSFVLLMPYGGYFGDYADDTATHMWKEALLKWKAYIRSFMNIYIYVCKYI